MGVIFFLRCFMCRETCDEGDIYVGSTAGSVVPSFGRLVFVKTPPILLHEDSRAPPPPVYEITNAQPNSERFTKATSYLAPQTLVSTIPHSLNLHPSLPFPHHRLPV